MSRFLTLFPLRPVGLFSRYKSPAKHLSYWHRPHTSKSRLPVLFIHGIGIGLYPYVPFLRELNSSEGIETGGVDDQVGIIAIEIMPVSFRITHPALAKEAMCAEIESIIQNHGFDQYVLVAHSYGTAIATQMLKSSRMAKQIGPVVLIDPITILLHLPDVAYNFTRRKPAEANEHQLYYFGSMDMGVSHTLARGFFWSDVILWKKDVGDRLLTVSLAQRDLIVNTEAVGQYLASSNNEWMEDTIHLQNGNCHAGDFAKVNGNGYANSNGSISNDSVKQNGYANGHVYNMKDKMAIDDWKSRPWRGRGLEILWYQGIDHAQVFDSRKSRKKLINAIKTYCMHSQAGADRVALQYSGKRSTLQAHMINGV